ncbi:hypothetical protein TRAPUB_934 [Trametes pubescens]|uniref:F-box domain-containing protein n=1 Tax=Trametes pubescens TaxID=154538 RepID=A0A1M2VKV1_TRAPU|nr:hypothetical protein TRAPUB_934 [Trametes pubescens]
MTFHPSPALMQEDVLHYVFEHASQPHVLAHSAAVCRAWTIPVQAALYRELEYSPLACSPREALLARTLRTRSHLLRFIRRLCLVTAWTHSPIADLCDWIKHIPADHLQNFCWRWERGHPPPSIIDFPAIRGTHHITLKGRLYSLNSIRPVLELPYLQCLSLELSGDERGSLSGITRPTNLRTLHLVAHEGYSPALDALISAVGPQLETLHLTSRLGDDPERDAFLASCVAAHCPGLTRLEINAIVMPKTPIPIADELVQHCRSLEHLHAASGTFTPGLFRAIPPTLRVLRLPFIPEYDALLLEFLEDARRSRDGLATLELVVGPGDEEQCERVEDACRMRGIAFRLYDE